MNEIEKLREDIAFLQKIEPLIEELEAARAVKRDDPERWFNAKQAFEEERRYWRLIGEYLSVTNATVNTEVVDAHAEGYTLISEGK